MGREAGWEVELKGLGGDFGGGSWSHDEFGGSRRGNSDFRWLPVMGPDRPARHSKRCLETEAMNGTKRQNILLYALRRNNF
jgi:hypothetical protein